MSVEEVVAFLREPYALDDTAEAAPALEALCCHPDLVDRLTELGRFVRARRVFVGGCPVLLDATTAGPFAAAWGTHVVMLRLGEHPGALAVEPPHIDGLDNDWVRVNPWPQDVTFRRGTDLLRDVVGRAAVR